MKSESGKASAEALGAAELAEQRRSVVAVFYLLLSVMVGILAAWLGASIARAQG